MIDPTLKAEIARRLGTGPATNGRAEHADMVPQHLRVRVGDLEFAALAWGQPGAPLALCLHGFPDTAWTWRHLGPVLAEQGRRVVAPFMRGYAPTDLAPDGAYQVGALARDILGLHAALGGRDDAALIGHDWGAIATYAAVARDPRRFRRVVTLAVPPLSTVWPPPAPVLGVRQLRRSWYVYFNQVPVLAERALPDLIPRLWASWSPGYDASEDVPRVLAALAEPARRTAALRYYRAFLQPWARSAAYAAEQEHAEATPRTPLLYLHGAEDGALRAEYAEYARAVLAPGSEVVVVPAAGHFLHLERPVLVNQRISAYLRT